MVGVIYYSTTHASNLLVTAGSQPPHDEQPLDDKVAFAIPLQLKCAHLAINR